MAVSPTEGQFDSELTKLAREVILAEQHRNANQVRHDAAVRNSLESLSKMEGIMDSTLKAERAEFLTVFGGDCHRVAILRARVGQLQGVLADSLHAADRRLHRSFAICKSVEDVLESVNLGKALAAAQLRAQARIAVTMAPKKEAVPTLEDQPALTRMSTKLRATTLMNLDDADSYIEARAIIESLFEVYDWDCNGVLQGLEAETAINDLVTHVMREGAERSSRYGGKTFLPSDEEDVREWVWQAVDEDGNREITPAEAIRGFMKVVDDIDKPEERLASMAKRGSLPCAPTARVSMAALDLRRSSI